MQQGNLIFGALLFAYIVYITQKGELSTYLTLLRGGGKEGSQGNVTVGQALAVPLSGLGGTQFNSPNATGGIFTGPSTSSSGNDILSVFGNSSDSDLSNAFAVQGGGL